MAASQTHGNVRCKQVAIHCSRWRTSIILGWYSQVRRGGTRRLIHGFLGHKIRAFKHRKPVSF